MIKRLLLIAVLTVSFLPFANFAEDEKPVDIAADSESFNPEVYIKEQKKLHEERIKEANKKYSDSRKKRNKKIIAAIKEYIEKVKATRKYWAEKGNLEKVLFYKKLQEKLEKSLKQYKDSIID